MSDDNFDWTEYANNPDDGATIINLIKENESLKSELERIRKENLGMRNCFNCHFGHIQPCPIDCRLFDQWELKK